VPSWELLLQQVTRAHGVTSHGTPLASSPLQLVVNNEEGMKRQMMLPGPAMGEPPDASENNRRQQVAEAASSFHLCCRPH